MTPNPARETLVATTAGPMTATDLLVAVLSGVPVVVLRPKGGARP